MGVWGVRYFRLFKNRCVLKENAEIEKFFGPFHCRNRQFSALKMQKFAILLEKWTILL